MDHPTLTHLSLRPLTKACRRTAIRPSFNRVERQSDIVASRSRLRRASLIRADISTTNRALANTCRVEISRQGVYLAEMEKPFSFTFGILASYTTTARLLNVTMVGIVLNSETICSNPRPQREAEVASCEHPLTWW